MTRIGPTPIVLSAFLVAAGGAPAAAATLLPDFSAAVFVPGADVDNPYFPLFSGKSDSLVASGTDEDGEPFTERTDLSFAGAGPVILGIATTTQLDRAYENGLLVEETYDYYAQDSEGNVWYFGEDVTNFVYDDDGNLIDTNSASSWRAGVNDALPGYIMPAGLQVGLAYFQEFAEADEALDQASIFAVGETVTAGGQVFEDVLVTFETTSLDPAARELKYYAPGIGLIRIEEGVDRDFGNPSLVFNRVTPAPVPLPAGLPLLVAALAALVAGRARHVGSRRRPV